MNRILTLVAVWTGWFITMTVIGYIAYNVGNNDWQLIAPNLMGGDALALIVRNALIAATFLALFFDAMRYRRGVRG